MRSWVAIRLDRRWINCFTLVMEEDGSMRPSAERQDYGQGSDSGGKKIVVFVELHSNTWEDRSLRDDGLYIESKGDEFAENQAQTGVELLGWDFEDALMEVEPLAMVAEPHSPGCDAGTFDKIEVGNRQKSAWLLQNLKVVGKVLGASYEGFEDRVEKFLKSRLDAIKGTMLIRERKKVLV